MRARDLLVVAAAALPLTAGAQAGGYLVETVATGLEHPWSLAFLPDGSMLVTERAGRLRVIGSDGRLRSGAVTGVPVAFVVGQAGLFEVAPAPDFAESRVVYLSYACGDRHANNTCLARGRYHSGALTDVETVFEAMPKKRGSAHYGGRIAFLPDGTLALSLGDGFDYRERAQSSGDHLGTIVRLNPDGSVPADNPFDNEVWSFGHRNVQGLVFDPESGRLIAHEHGPRGGDELNVIERGGNYGWPLATFGLDYTGAMITPNQSLEGTAAPAFQWTPSIAPSGLAVYRGGAFPDWDGDLLVGALKIPGVYRLQFEQGVWRQEQRLLAGLRERIRDVRVAADGTIYVLTDSPDGRVLRVVPAAR